MMNYIRSSFYISNQKILINKLKQKMAKNRKDKLSIKTSREYTAFSRFSIGAQELGQILTNSRALAEMHVCVRERERMRVIEHGIHLNEQLNCPSFGLCAKNVFEWQGEGEKDKKASISRNNWNANVAVAHYICVNDGHPSRKKQCVQNADVFIQVR